jgi:integrase
MREIATPTPEELRRLVDTSLQGRQPNRANLLIFLALTGMRRGEACALHWDDVELEQGLLTIRSSIIDVGTLIERQPKTGRVRKIALGDLGTALLKDRRSVAEKVASAIGAELHPHAFVWSDAEDGLEPLKPGTLTQYFSRLVVQCGYVNRVGHHSAPKYSLHSLRHFAATQLVGANVDVRTVSNRTGHSDATTVLRIYAHALEGRDVDAANILGRIIEHDGSLTAAAGRATA